MEENLVIAHRLHSAAIHLLRRLRRQDAAAGLPAPWLSALSVLTFGGPRTMTELAEAEQVRPPTISRLVKDMERDGLVQRVPDPVDGRVQRVQATERGQEVLYEGRARRVSVLAKGIEALTVADKVTLAQALPILERLTLPPDHQSYSEQSITPDTE
jgi:DNA-binding MarR family transcriptional regulator